MYLRYYGLSEKPFELSPNPKFLFPAAGTREALEAVQRGLENRQGLIVLTGEVGTGKTILIHTLLSSLPEKIKTAFIFHPTFSLEELLERVLDELGETGSPGETGRAPEHLVAYLGVLRDRGEMLAVCIDEAQRLSEVVIRGLVSLLAREVWVSEVFQLVLVGQPELEPLLEDVWRRYRPEAPGINVRIGPLSETEAREYIFHRLRIAGGDATALFSPQALTLITGYARGIPRVINNVANNALLVGYSESLKKIEAPVIREVIEELEGPGAEQKARKDPARRAFFLSAFRYGLVGAALVVGVLLSLWAASEFMGTISLFQGGKGGQLSTVREEKAAAPGASKSAETSGRQTLTIERTEADKTAMAEAIDEEVKRPETKESSPVVKAARGEGLLKLALRHYGRADESLVDLILFHNPSITDADHILVDQEIQLPPLTPESLLVPGPDKTISIHLGTFPDLKRTKAFQNSLPLPNDRVAVQPRKVAPQVTWFRVEGRGYRSKTEALADVGVLREKGVLPFF